MFWINQVRSKLVNYYVLKTDPLDETKETLNEIEKYNEDDFKNIPNIFENPFKKSTKLKKKPNLSAHEQIDGIIYGVCCTGSNSKQSVIDWTKFLINTNPCLERYVIVYRIKDKPGFLAVINNNNNKNKEEKN
jgi:signaling intermediate in Toll pathway protein